VRGTQGGSARACQDESLSSRPGNATRCDGLSRDQTCSSDERAGHEAHEPKKDGIEIKPKNRSNTVKIKVPLLVLSIAAIVAIVVLAVPEAHALALAPIDPAGIMLAIGAAAVPTDVTSKMLRSLQAKAAQLQPRIQELLDLEAAASPGKASEYGAERIRVGDELTRVCVAMQNERARIFADANGQPTTGFTTDNREVPYRPSSARHSGRRFRELFTSLPQQSEFASLAEMVSILHSGLTDQRMLAAVAGGSEGVGADGGFLIPPAFAATLMDASMEDEIVRPLARVEPMIYATKTVAGLDTQDHSSDIGGLTGVWLGEGSTLTGQKPRLRALVLTAQKLGILLPMTNEWISDAPDADDQISRALIAAISWHLDYAFLNGTGGGQPKGVLNDIALIVAAKEGGQAAATITYENIKAMYARLHPACVPNAVWVCNQGARAQMLGLVQYVKNAAGTDFVGGSGVPIVKQLPGGKMTLLGLPLLFTEKLPALGTQGDIVLADLSQYIVGLRSEMSIKKSEHLYFDSDQTAYRILLRADGRGAWSKVMTPKNGATLSWCVALQAR
jgi:HK97 family phage major capsid protein